MAKNETFLANVDEDKVQELMSDTDNNVEYFNKVATETAIKYTEPLDKLMRKIYSGVVSREATDAQLEKYYLELTNTIYFMGDKLEQLNISGDMAKASEKEVYNNAYLANQIKDSERKNKTTVAENQAVAEQESQYEAVVSSIYDHAYKMVKFKIDAAKDMVNTLRKIISRRMQEQQLASFGNNKISNSSAFMEED